MTAPSRDDPFLAAPDSPDSFSDRRILIFGVGTFGGGVGAARFLASRGAEVHITDLRSAEQLAPSLAALEDVPIAGRRLGGHDVDDFGNADIVVVNPAVPPGNPLLGVALRAGARLVTEIGLFLAWCPTPFVAGVTGSNGKSTTVRLLADLLSASGYRTRVGGNFGGSLLGDLDAIDPEDRIVLELSSFQLARIAAGTPRPAAVGITQIVPNHLDWHGSFADYRAAKEEILDAPARSVPSGTRVAAVPSGEPGLAALAVAGGRRVVLCGPGDPGVAADSVPSDFAHGVTSEITTDVARDVASIGVRDDALVLLDENGITRLAALDRFPRRGAPHYANAATAAALALALGADPARFEETIAAQRPLPHRQEEVGRVGGITFVDDSKATTPEAAGAAVEALAPGAILLAGGRHKGGDLAALARAVRDGARRAVCYGECREELAAALRDGGVTAEFVDVRDDLASAFRRATEVAGPGDVVLLSPACASFDEFTNFEARADRFRSLIAEYGRDLRGPDARR